MGNTKVEVRCSNCRRWFRSPIVFGGVETFDASTLFGNEASCSHCGETTECNKENIRISDASGGFVAKDTTGL